MNESAYIEAMDPAFERAPHASDGFENMKLISDGTGTRVEGPVSPGGPARNNRRFEYHSISPGGRFDGGEGTIGLDYYAIGYEPIPPEKSDDYSVRVFARYYDGNLKPMPDEKVLDRFPSEWERQLSFDWMFPAVRFGFRLDLTEEVKVLGYQLLDPLLERTLSQGYSWGGSDDTQYVDARLRRWHTGPAELVMDVAFGPVETYEFASEAGTVQEHPGGQVKVIGLLPDMRSHSSSQSRDSVSIGFVPVDENEKPITTVVIASLPDANQVPLEFSFLDPEGNELRTRGLRRTHHFIQIAVTAEPAKLQTVRMKRYPHSKRLIFDFPVLPGLPTENDSIDNLFDARIPYVRVRHQHEMTSILEGLTGLKISGLPGRLQATFPVSYESITVEELFDEYLGMHQGDWPKVTIDPASGRIEITQPPGGNRWQAWFERLWQRVRP